jgi:hypothetical protein
MIEPPYSTKLSDARAIAAQARLFAEIAADCSRGIFPGDYSKAGIADLAAKTEEIVRAMRAEADSQSVLRSTQKPQVDSAQSVPRGTQKTQADSALPDALRTPAEAARKLGCSIKTLDGYVKAGALKYVALGHGKRRQRRRFTDADLSEFITNQTRKDSPCPSDATRARRSGNTDSKSEVVSFSALQRRRTGAKPKK